MNGDAPKSERLYALLPLIHRQRDAEQGEPLRALLAIIEEQLQRVEGDIWPCTTTGSSRPAPTG